MPKRSRASLVLTQGQALEVAIAAHANAQRLRDAAACLIELGHNGAGAALAVLGVEEASKSFHAYVHSVAGRAKPGMWGTLFSQHRPKQASGVILQMLGTLGPRIERFVDGKIGLFDRRFPNATEVERAEKLMLWQLRFTQRFVQLRPETLRRIVVAVGDELHKAVALGELDALKLRGLYVDFDEATGREHDPRDVTASASDRPLAILDQELRTLDGLRPIASMIHEGARLDGESPRIQSQHYFLRLLAEAGLPPSSTATS